MYIFISHSSADAACAQRMCEKLEENGLTCFIAPRDIKAGSLYAEEIVDGIDRSDAMILLLSQKADGSPHVLREIERACSKKIPIYVYKLEDFSLSKAMEYFVMTHQWVDQSSDRQFEKLLTTILESQNKAAETVDAKENKEQTPVERNDKNPKKILVPVVCAAGVVACIGAGIFLLRDKNAKKSGAEPTGIVNDVTGQQENNTQTQSGNGKEEVTQKKSVKVGDTVTLGSYNGMSVEWRVIRVNEDGTAILLSKDILSMKCYDAAEGGSYNTYDKMDYWTTKVEDFALQKLLRGSNEWKTSNIRTWLNSDAELVSYADMAPGNSAMSEKKNGYDEEAGFLCGFSETEKLALVKTKNLTKNGDGTEQESEDLVWLLSENELAWLSEAGMSYLAAPTEAAIEKDKTKSYENFSSAIGYVNYFWLLRDAAENSGCEVLTVNNNLTESKILKRNAGAEMFGIRPAICIDPDKLAAD